MDFYLILNVVFAFYVAWIIGSNNQSMAPVTGSGFRSLTVISLAGGVSSLLGTIFIGKNVESTIGEGIIVGKISSVEALIVLFSITAWITFASYKGWPTSSTHSAVGATVGLGLVTLGSGGVQWEKLTLIISAWALTPLIGLSAGYFLTVYINHVLKNYVKGLGGIVKVSKLSAYALFTLACLTSFLSGGNDVGNATAFINPTINIDAVFLRGFMGIGMLLGLIMLGRRVLFTVGVELVELTPISGLASLLSTSLVMLVANFYGLPLSNSQILVSSVVGTGLANKRYINLEKIIRIFITWVATFVTTALLCSVLYLGFKHFS